MPQVKLHEYTLNWKRRYSKAAKEITTTLNGEKFTIDHVGSTSVPGLLSKSEIDIAIGVPKLSSVKKWVDKLRAVNYLYYPKFESMAPNRRYFRKGTKARPLVHVHVYQQDDPVYIQMLQFRDLMREDKRVRDDYAKAKRKLAKEYKNDWMSYMTKKYEFIKSVLKK